MIMTVMNYYGHAIYACFYFQEQSNEGNVKSVISRNLKQD